MKIIAVLALLFIAVSGEDLEWESCNPDNWGEGNIALSPYPLPVVSGTSLDVKALFDLHKDLDGDVDVEIKLVKKGIVSIPIPCIESPSGLHLGACSYKLEEIVTKYKNFLCPDYFPEGQDCAFPLKAGEYGGKISGIILPEIPPSIANFAKGTIHGTLSVSRNG
uniref:Ganglioside GM2 activatorlike [Anolis carolinensis] n=1 Tax=Lepeophtheirus salmonis TaxID=72036 RepID=A0A0K2T8U0_LEPSM